MQVENALHVGIFRENEACGHGLEAIRQENIRLAKTLACRKDPNHAWPRLDAKNLLERTGLAKAGEAGQPCKLTWAGLLIFGKEALLKDILPGRGIEVEAQLLDPEGYDHHESLSCNLFEAFQRLMGFVRRNYPEGTSLDNAGFPCLRDAIFGELFSNLLVHRDYGTPRPARVLFQQERVAIENPNRPVKRGLIDLAWSESFPKNPTLYSFFREIGWISEPGRGMSLFQSRGEEYFGTPMLAFDRENFKVIAPSTLDFPVQMASGMSSMQVSGAKKNEGTMKPGLPSKMNSSTRTMQVLEVPIDPFTAESPAVERVRRILAFCETPRNREEIQKHVGLNNRDHFRKEILLPLLREGRLVATIPDKPNSPKQRYRTAEQS